MRIPHSFQIFLAGQSATQRKFNKPQLSFIASWNEWSEGHYLEPDERFGTAWLEAVRKEKQMPSDWAFVSIDMELTNRCSTDCLMCPREAITRPKGMMSECVFKAVSEKLVSEGSLITFLWHG